MEGIGARTIEKIEINSQEQGDSIYQYLNNYWNIINLSQESEGNAITDQLKISPKQTAKICEFILKINNFKNTLDQKKSLTPFISEVLEAFAY